MSDDVIPFRPKGKPEQLSIEQVRAMKPEDVEAARQGGHLTDLLKRGPKAPPPDPSTPPARSS
jgi:hypothetical protein